MKCDEVLTLLGPLVDDELPTDTTAIVMQHIASCFNCQQEWDAHLALNKQFQQLDDSITVPPRGLTNIDRRINAMNACRDSRVKMFAAAAIVATGLICLPFFQRQSEPQPTVFEQVLQSYPRKPVLKRSSESIDSQLAKLSHHVKFKPSAVDLPGWSLASADVVHLPGHTCLLRLVFTADGPGQRTIAVYQSCQGQLRPRGLEERSVAGRNVRCGQINGLAVVHWSDAERDQLFVSSLSEQDLMSALRV